MVGYTVFVPPEGIEPWVPEGNTGADLVEMFGRACYQSWHKPNPATATNEGYLEHIIDVGHLSVTEHGYVSFYIEGISRACSHEIVRHRMFNFSQISQRFVDESKREWDPIIPPLFSGDKHATTLIEQATSSALTVYDQLVELAIAKGAKRKQAREAARAVLPNANETKIGMTGNYRAWRHFLHMRGAEHADREIRGLAVEIASQLTNLEGVKNVFADVEIYKANDGELAVKVGKAENG